MATDIGAEPFGHWAAAASVIDAEAHSGRADETTRNHPYCIMVNGERFVDSEDFQILTPKPAGEFWRSRPYRLPNFRAGKLRRFARPYIAPDR